MPLFRYSAVSAQGKTLKGVIDADSLPVAKERLRRQQVLVTTLIPLQNKRDQITLPPPLLLALTRELSQLLRAGLPLYESLLTIEEKYRRHKAHPLFLDLCDHLKEGAPLSSVMKKYPASFDRIYLSMVHVAEQSGNLAGVFDQLSQLISRQQKLKKQLISALAYPSFLAVFCCFIISGLLFFVIPSMKELFEGRALHPVTTLVVSISNWANAHVIFLIAALTTGISGILLCVRSRSGKRLLYEFSLKLPFVKTLILHSALVRFCRSFSMLMAGGVPLLDALSLARNVVKSPLLEEAIANAEKRVAQGERISAAFTGSAIMPPLVIRMLALSEETGKMGDAFHNLSEIYEEEMEKHLAQLNTVLQPALLITLGAIVGLVVLSILLPMTDMSSFTAN
ncbi:MAG: type II secretion system F family protein [Candidatus Melainabacteria bacterium]|nr:type II secretion system F family protein [Candidatus Melainabacteria bacterium]